MIDRIGSFDFYATANAVRFGRFFCRVPYCARCNTGTSEVLTIFVARQYCTQPLYIKINR